MRFFDLFKRRVDVRYVPIEPRFQTLGNIEGNLYFMNSITGKVFRISRDRVSEYETVSHVFTTIG